MTELRPTEPPEGLKPRGRGLWREILQTYALDAGELLLLAELCATVDRIDELDRELAEQGLTVTGKRGQLPKANPLLTEIREERKAVSRIVAELALPMPGETVGRRRSPAQKHAAHARWRQHG